MERSEWSEERIMAESWKRNKLRFLSSFLPHPITVHIVPDLILFKPGGGKQIGSKCSWNATRVASWKHHLINACSFVVVVFRFSAQRWMSINNKPGIMRCHCRASHPNCIADAVEHVALLLFVHNMCANFVVWFPTVSSNYWYCAVICCRCNDLPSIPIDRRLKHPHNRKPLQDHLK